MAEFIGDCVEKKEEFANRNKIAARFRIKPLYCIPQLNVQNYTCKSLSFILDSLEWRLDVMTRWGKMDVVLSCLSNALGTLSYVVNSRLNVLTKESMEVEHLAYLPEQICNNKKKSMTILKDYCIYIGYLTNDVTLELWLKLSSNRPSTLDKEIKSEQQNKTRRQKRKNFRGKKKIKLEKDEKMKTTKDPLQTRHDELRIKQEHADDNHNLHVLSEASLLIKTEPL